MDANAIAWDRGPPGPGFITGGEVCSIFWVLLFDTCSSRRGREIPRPSPTRGLMVLLEAESSFFD
jgi:hypothetical protein